MRLVNLVLAAGFTFVGLMFIAFLWACFLVGAGAVNDARCLEAGYPHASTTWTGKGYCLTVDGVVRPRVEELP